MAAGDESAGRLVGSVSSADCIFVCIKTRSAVTASLVVASVPALGQF